MGQIWLSILTIVMMMMKLMVLIKMMMMMMMMIIKIKSILCDASDKSICKPDFLREIKLSLSLIVDLLIS